MDLSLFKSYCEIVFNNIIGIVALSSVINLACKCIYLQLKETLKSPK